MIGIIRKLDNENFVRHFIRKMVIYLDTGVIYSLVDFNKTLLFNRKRKT